MMHANTIHFTFIALMFINHILDFNFYLHIEEFNSIDNVVILPKWVI